MKTDYKPFLAVQDDGSIWWTKDQAIKLGAGYIPMSDDHQNLIPELHAPNNRVLINERTLIGALSRDYPNVDRPRVIERDDYRFVEAREFLVWLSQYVAQAQSSISFPCDLAQMVTEATSKPRLNAMVKFESLTASLEDHFDKSLHSLPQQQWFRVDRDFFPMNWGMLSPDQRRSVAQQWDNLNDPATEEKRLYWWHHFVQKNNIEKQITKWEAVDVPTAKDLAEQETRLTELRNQLADLEKNKDIESQSTKLPGHLNHDPELQARANQIAAELMTATTRSSITKQKVAKILSKEVGKPMETVLRRIRKEW